MKTLEQLQDNLAAAQKALNEMTDEQVVRIFLEETGFGIGHVINLLTRISISRKLDELDDNS